MFYVYSGVYRCYSCFFFFTYTRPYKVISTRLYLTLIFLYPRFLEASLNRSFHPFRFGRFFRLFLSGSHVITSGPLWHVLPNYTSGFSKCLYRIYITCIMIVLRVSYFQYSFQSKIFSFYIFFLLISVRFFHRFSYPTRAHGPCTPNTIAIETIRHDHTFPTQFKLFKKHYFSKRRAFIRR